MPDQDPLLWTAGTFVLRLGEAVIAAIPDLLVGVLLAGLMRHFLGDHRLRRWFGNCVGVAIATVVLPMGAAGVLPVAVMLKRAGVRLAGVASVLLVGGAVGPLAVAYLMERATPLAAGVLLLMLAAAAGVVFLIVARVERPVEPAGDDAAGLMPALAEAKPLLRVVALPLVAGLIVFAAIASFLPPSFAGEAMHDPSAFHGVVAVALPPLAYYGQQIAALFTAEAAAGAYPGAAWTMLLGGGVTVGTITLSFLLLGKRSGFVAVGSFVIMLLIGFFALSVAPRLVPLSAEDSHAFDGLSRPFHLLDDEAGTVAGVMKAWSNAATPATLASAVAIALLALIPMKPRAGDGQAHLSGGALATLAVVAGVGWAAMTLYTYFPSPPVVFDQMRHAEGDLSGAIADNDDAVATAALYSIDRLAARGSIGSRLRLDADTAAGFAGIRDDTARVRQLLTGQDDVTFRDVNFLFSRIRDLKRE